MSEIVSVGVPVEAIRAYCETQPIEQLSVLGTDFDDWLRPETEIGLLVEYLPGSSIAYIDIARQERELGEILDVLVDLRTPNELEKHSKQQVLEGATLVFAKSSGK